MATKRLTYDDMAGIPILRYNKATRYLMGQRPNALEPTPLRVWIFRCTFGLFGCLGGVSLLTAALNGAKISIARQEMKTVVKNLVLISTCISMLQKYFIFILQERGITRITLWMTGVRERNVRDKVQPSRLEVFLRKYNAFFYYGGNLAPWVLTTVPLLNGEEFCFKFPFIENDKAPFMIPILFFTHVIVAIELLYDATCLISMLLTFRSELLRLADEWAKMIHSDSDRTSFREKLKQNVKDHVVLITVFKDLKKLNNAMFGYQVFASLMPTCAMIYGCSIDAAFLRQAITQVLPIFLFAILEFVLLCWLGEEISYGFQNFHRAAHMTNWYEAEIEDQRALTIVLEFSKKTQLLTGFTVIECTLSTFVETMKQSFSLYAILQAFG